MENEDRNRLQSALMSLASCEEHLKALEELTLSPDVSLKLICTAHTLAALMGAIVEMVLVMDSEDTSNDLEEATAFLRSVPFPEKLDS